MSWERRGNHRYYYRKRRKGERVVSEYVGTDKLAQDATLLHVRRLKRRQWASLCALDAQIAQACDHIRALTHAMLLVTGYHTHKGQWRKRRAILSFESGRTLPAQNVHEKVGQDHASYHKGEVKSVLDG